MIKDSTPYKHYQQPVDDPSVVRVSPGEENERRDKQVKLKLYATQGVREYWIVDRQLQQIQIYRREQATLVLAATLFSTDNLSSPLLPGFTCSVASLFT
ncbi:Uma2 family endonuclease [Plectonema radiosum NIES-515]|uniref:Uma2 family endonuclease n=1 Tax=Plectonema radiosum NIES-515 TaxID=2986073 RepID=A0ABT3B4M5_9CYAN|nr:Uma2 family endonuclease [Plectonema radiosum]MCV3216328.1 Uma2 family endonuclease [Plectonema radiosum NIES-515]